VIYQPIFKIFLLSESGNNTRPNTKDRYTTLQNYVSVVKATIDNKISVKTHFKINRKQLHCLSWCL